MVGFSSLFAFGPNSDPDGTTVSSITGSFTSGSFTSGSFLSSFPLKASAKDLKTGSNNAVAPAASISNKPLLSLFLTLTINSFSFFFSLPSSISSSRTLASRAPVNLLSTFFLNSNLCFSIL